VLVIPFNIAEDYFEMTHKAVQEWIPSYILPQIDNEDHFCHKSINQEIPYTYRPIGKDGQ
jgi:hypothetical protein